MYMTSQDDNGNTIEYHFSNVAMVSWRGNTNPNLLPIPQEDNMVIGNFYGIRKIVGIEWFIKDSDVDLANGSYKDSNGNPIYIKSIKEQIDYLTSYFINGDVSLEINLVFEVSDWGSQSSYNVKPYSFNWSWQGGQKVVRARFEGYTSDIIV